jgi:transposase InsO family protein
VPTGGPPLQLRAWQRLSVRAAGLLVGIVSASRSEKGSSSSRSRGSSAKRLMRRLGLAGVVRGRKRTVTTVPDPATARPPDLVTRQVTAVRPNPLWVADLTYVATWRGFVYVAFDSEGVQSGLLPLV